MTTYRLATAADAEALARLRWDLFFEDRADEAEPDERAFVEGFVAFAYDALSSGRWAAWAADDDGGRLVANAWVHVVPKVPQPDRPPSAWGYLTNVYTVPAARDRGVGSELLRHLTAWAEDLRLELLMVWPSERSVPFYERAGFGPTEALQRDVAGYHG